MEKIGDCLTNSSQRHDGRVIETGLVVAVNWFPGFGTHQEMEWVLVPHR